MLPTLTLAVLTYKRPYYAIPTLYGLREKLHYAGERRFLVVDMGSDGADLEMYTHALRNEPARIYSRPLNLASAHNEAAAMSDDVWLVVLDDYELRADLDITNDVDYLLAHETVGALRYAALSQWGHSVGMVTEATLEEHQKHLYWRLHKTGTQPTAHQHIMAATLYHRRFWDAYGDIPSGGNPMPGECELRGANLFRNQDKGPAIAIPMRFGDSGPFVHIGYTRSDDYSARCGDAWGAIDVFDDARIGNVRTA